jgi:cell division septal protein FtsQ
VKLGQNLFALDLGRVKRDLEMVSVVHSVAVERIMPNTLRLRVVERAPLAQFYVPRLQGTNGFQMAVFRLDEEGCVIAALEPRQRSEPATPADEVYPEIRGGNLNDMAPGKRVDSAQVRAALKLISEFEHSPMAGLVDLQQVDVSSPNVLQVKTTQDCKVTFSALDFDKQFGRWREINDEARKMGKAISTLDLSVPNNIPVLFVDAGTLPPVIPRTKTPQHTRKKNV